MSAAAEERPLRVFVIAGEASGDRLGAALARGLRAVRSGPVELLGVGGPALAAEGLESLFDIDEIAVMGLAEVAPRLRAILRRIRETTEAAAAAAPDIVVSIDAPDFGLRVAKAARPRLGAKTLFAHYVAPSVWAWRPGRAKKYAARLDHLLALLPFEPPYFEREGLSCDFVGHPIVERAFSEEARRQAGAALRAELGVAEAAPLLAVAPGSRRGEVARLAPVFKEAVAALLAQRPDLAERGLQLIVPMAEARVSQLRAAPEPWPAPVHLIDPTGLPFETAEARKTAVFAAADAALAASGTVALEFAAARTPAVIGYSVSPITAFIVRRLLRIETGTLTNLVSETRAVPEFFQENCAPEPIAAALSALLPARGRESPERAAQIAAAEATMAALGEGGAPPSQRAALSLLRALEQRRASR
ncbi:MAG: lipid-A-disaccharide synthase [Pseudomonadota bacterium]